MRFFDSLGVEYSTFPKFVYIFCSSYLLKSENLSKRLNNFDFSLDDPLVVIVYAVVVCIILKHCGICEFYKKIRQSSFINIFVNKYRSSIMM